MPHCHVQHIHAVEVHVDCAQLLQLDALQYDDGIGYSAAQQRPRQLCEHRLRGSEKDGLRARFD